MPLSSYPKPGCVTKDEPSQCFYIKLKPSTIPPGWDNNPGSLSLDDYLNFFDDDCLMYFWKTQFRLPFPLPILSRSNHGYMLLAGGGGKYYVWEMVGDQILEVYERDLAKILATFCQNCCIGGTMLRNIGTAGSGEPDYSAPWIPCGPF